MRVVYFVHDLNDPAVERRLTMLRTGGLDTVVTGFWRGHAPPGQIAGSPVLPLGRTYDSKFAQRGLAALRQMAMSGALRRKLGSADLYVARNLEMLAVAVAAARNAQAPTPIVYEVLDIHRLLLSEAPQGKFLRAIERSLMRHADLLITSSPAFLREYFEPEHLAQRPKPTLLVENKLLRAATPMATQPEIAPGPPWRIGWFGMIRCEKSFAMLSRLAKNRPDLVEIVIAGRPAQSVFGDFERRVQSSPGVEYLGPYAPSQLSKLYGSVHFNWAVDYFEQGANSEWLLPNRIYEGGSFDAVPLALRRTETGSWLWSNGLGVLFEDIKAELKSFLGTLDAGRYGALKAASREAPRSTFIADGSDCARLAAALTRVVERRQPVRIGSAGQFADAPAGNFGNPR